METAKVATLKKTPDDTRFDGISNENIREECKIQKVYEWIK